MKDDDDDKGECVEEEEQQQQHAEYHRQGTTTLSGMESSVFSFQSVNFTVGKKDKKKQILQDVSGRVKWGHVLAILGPSGAGEWNILCFVFCFVCYLLVDGLMDAKMIKF